MKETRGFFQTRVYALNGLPGRLCRPCSSSPKGETAANSRQPKKGMVNNMKNNAVRRKIPWRIIFNGFVLLFCIGLILYFCFSDGGLTDLIRSKREIRIGWLLAAVVVYLSNIVMDVFLVYWYVKPSAPGITFLQSMKTGLAGMFYSAVTPGASGGQPMQVFMLSRYGVEAGKATSALMQRLLVWQFTLTGYSIVVILLRFSFFMEHLSTFWWIMAIVGLIAQIAFIILLLMVSYSPKITGGMLRFVCRVGGKLRILKHPDQTMVKLKRHADGFHVNNNELRKRKGSQVVGYVVTALQFTAIYAVPYFVYRALTPSGAVTASLVDVVSAQSFVYMISSLFPIPGGSGMAETSFGGFFGGIFDPAAMKSAILIWRMITYYGTIAVCAPFSGIVKKRKMSREEESGVSQETQQ